MWFVAAVVALLVAWLLWRAVGLRPGHGVSHGDGPMIPAADDSALERPVWAAGLSRDDAHQLLRLVKTYFERHGLSLTETAEGTFRIEGGSAEDQGMMVGLWNLAQLCAQTDREAWPQVVEEHFDFLGQGLVEQERLLATIDDFGSVRDYLTLRVYEEGYSQLSATRLVSRCDLPGTITALVFDLPSVVRCTTREETAAWGRSDAELWRIALENLRGRAVPDEIDRIGPAGAEVVFMGGDSHFVASGVLLLEERPELLGRYGSIVAIPHRHVLLGHPVDDWSVLEPVQRVLMPVVAQLWAEGPGSISPHLYWYRSGLFELIEAEVLEDRIRYPAEDRLRQMLAVVLPPG